MSKTTTYYAQSPCINQLCEDYGDRLQLLGKFEKFSLIAVLATWQHLKQEMLETDQEVECLLSESIADYPYDGTGDVLQALQIIEDITDHDAIGLIMAIANQLFDGVYQQ